MELVFRQDDLIEEDDRGVLGPLGQPWSEEKVLRGLHHHHLHSRVVLQEHVEEVNGVGGDLSAGVPELVDQNGEEPLLLLWLGLEQSEGRLDGALLEKVEIVLGEHLDAADELNVEGLDPVLDVANDEDPIVLLARIR